MPYKHLFFDLDHTLWDFETNSKDTLKEVFFKKKLNETLTEDFDGFHDRYSFHNKKLWDRYHNGFIKQEELKWKRMWLTLLDYKNGDEQLAKQMAVEYLEILPYKKAIFPYTVEILDYLKNKNYLLHLITNGFDELQWGKLVSSKIEKYFINIVTSEKAMALKPHKDIFEYALKVSGAEKHESIMLGDNLDADIKGAMDFGLDTVFVNHINEPTNLKPTYTVYSLKELENIF